METHFPRLYSTYRGSLDDAHGDKTDARFWCENDHLVVKSFVELPTVEDVKEEVSRFERRWDGLHVNDAPTGVHRQSPRPICLALPEEGMIADLALEAECAPVSLQEGDVLFVLIRRLRDAPGDEFKSAPISMRSIYKGAFSEFQRRIRGLQNLKQRVATAGPDAVMHLSSTTPLLRGTLVTISDNRPLDGTPVLQDVGLVRVQNERAKVSLVMTTTRTGAVHVRLSTINVKARFAITTVIVRMRFRHNVGDDCVICLAPVTDMGKQCAGCLHVCHAQCLERWHQASRSPTCPTCRRHAD